VVVIRVELAAALVAAFVIALVAGQRERNGLVWGSITFALCVGGICVIGIPYVRIAAGAALAGGAFVVGRWSGT
jgi:hypothetical protein